jgi:hypothetical protein
MYNRNNFETAYISNAKKRVFNIGSDKTSEGSNQIRTCKPFGHKTWPEVIILYREIKKENASRS